jgi:hypothetical protein
VILLKLSNNYLILTSIIYIAIILSSTAFSNVAGDPYADSIVEEHSSYYYDGENAIGAPDGNFASIFLSYTIGSLMLDMGKSESILDGDGNDLKVVAEGNYTVWVGNNPSQPMTTLGIGMHNQSYDLSTIGSNESRYIRIDYNGGANVLLDAIVAYNYNVPEDNTTPTTDTGDIINLTGLAVVLIVLVKRKLR